jgi:hypothetical protein
MSVLSLLFPAATRLGECAVLAAAVGVMVADSIVAPAVAASAPDAAGMQHYAGIAYAGDGDQPVYREEHWVYQDGGAWRRLVLYRCPEGPSFAPFARKWVQTPPGGSPYAPDFDLVDARSGYREGVREADGGRQVYFQEDTRAALQSAPLPARTGAVIDTGFDAYVRGHWTELAGKSYVSVPFLVPSRLGYMDLKLGAATATQLDGRDARRLRMTLDAWYGFAAPSLNLFYAADSHRLLRFQGISNIRDDAGRTQNVRIEFPENLQYAPPSRQEVDRAAALPLARRCS